jgi:dipeptidyl aminopeptidase/acylaminoacyl peptidase
MKAFSNKNGKKIHGGGGKFYSLWIVLVLLIVATCSCNRSDLQPTLFIPTASPVKISPTNSPIPTEIPTFTPVPSATLTPTVAPSPTKVIPFPHSTLFSSLKPGQYFLYKIDSEFLGILSADGQEKIEIVLPSPWTAKDTRLSLSPDHKKLALFRNIMPGDSEKESLLIVDLEGGDTHLLMSTKACYDVTWSPDGNQLVAGCGQSLYLFFLITGEKIELPADCQGACLSVKWSPDGKWIAFQHYDLQNNRMDDEREGVFLLSTACLVAPGGCSASNIERISTFSYPAPYDWSPDGQYLVLTNWIIKPGVTDRDTLLDLFHVPTRRVQRQIKISGILSDSFLKNPSLAWSPDGKWIAMIQAKGIYKASIQGGNPVLVAPLDWPWICQWISIPHPFAPGAKYTITPAGNGLNLRDQPSQAGKPLKVLKAGDEITIVKGPILADGYTWWQMRTKDGVEGWAEDLPDWYQ